MVAENILGCLFWKESNCLQGKPLTVGQILDSREKEILKVILSLTNLGLNLLPIHVGSMHSFYYFLHALASQEEMIVIGGLPD